MHNLTIRILKNILALSAALAMLTFVTGCSKSESTEKDGLSHYTLSNEFLDSTVLGVDTPELFRFTGRINNQRDQEWIFTSTDDGDYRITNRLLGDSVSLDVINDGVFETLNMSPSSDVGGQKWQVTPLGNGYCRLTNSFLGTEIALDVVSDADSPTITMRAMGDFSGQHWSFTQWGFQSEMLDGECSGESD